MPRSDDEHYISSDSLVLLSNLANDGTHIYVTFHIAFVIDGFSLSDFGVVVIHDGGVADFMMIHTTRGDWISDSIVLVFYFIFDKWNI